MNIGPERDFIVTSSINGIVRLWTPGFDKLVSEVNTQQPIIDSDIGDKEIALLSSTGALSILDL